MAAETSSAPAAITPVVGRAAALLAAVSDEPIPDRFVAASVNNWGCANKNDTAASLGLFGVRNERIVLQNLWLTKVGESPKSESRKIYLAASEYWFTERWKFRRARPRDSNPNRAQQNTCSRYRIIDNDDYLLHAGSLDSAAVFLAGKDRVDAPVNSVAGSERG
jgi:hypothetical protein